MRMTTAERVTRSPEEEEALRRLVDGARMDQKTFHALYLLTPPGFEAELIGGVVYVASPVSRRHSKPHAALVHWLMTYEAATPGVEGLDDGTAVLGDESEPQPDAALLIRPEFGGQSAVEENDCVAGSPELVAEVSDTTAGVDLGAKKVDYLAGGAKEYVVVDVGRRAVHWFARRRGKWADLPAGVDGYFRSATFPGLWLDPAAVLDHRLQQLTAALVVGLATPEHAAFVAELEARRKAKAKPKKSKRKTKKPE